MRLKDLILQKTQINIQYIFLKLIPQGKKTYEEFYSENEDYVIDKYESIGYIKAPKTKLIFDQVIINFKSVFSNPNCTKKDIINTIKKYVPDFMHIETGKNLDQKM